MRVNDKQDPQDNSKNSHSFALLPLTPVFVWLGVFWAVPALTEFVQFFTIYGYFICWPIASALGLVDLGMTISNRISVKWIQTPAQ